MRERASRLVRPREICKAPTPATWGVAMEVPLRLLYPLGSPSVQEPVGTAERIETLGAATSSSGPVDEKGSPCVALVHCGHRHRVGEVTENCPRPTDLSPKGTTRRVHPDRGRRPERGNSHCIEVRACAIRQYRGAGRSRSSGLSNRGGTVS